MKWLGLTFVLAAVLSFSGRDAVADVWINGHGDIGAGLAGGELELHFHFENDATGEGGTILAGEYAPSDHFIRVADPSTGRASGVQWNFLGNAAGESVWILPMVEDPLRPYLGFGLEELDVGEWTGDLTWKVNSLVQSPSGSFFSMWTTDTFGEPDVVSVATFTGADSFDQTAGSHRHFNLGFTKEGLYEIEFQISGSHNTLGNLTDTARFTFLVGNSTAVPEPTSLFLLGSVLSSGAAFAWRRKFARRNSPLAN